MRKEKKHVFTYLRTFALFLSLSGNVVCHHNKRRVTLENRTEMTWRDEISIPKLKPVGYRNSCDGLQNRARVPQWIYILSYCIWWCSVWSWLCMHDFRHAWLFLTPLCDMMKVLFLKPKTKCQNKPLKKNSLYIGLLLKAWFTLFEDRHGYIFSSHQCQRGRCVCLLLNVMFNLSLK